MKIKHVFVVLTFLSLVFVGFSHNAAAAWPAGSLVPGKISMAVEYGTYRGVEVHTELDHYFAGFIQGDSRAWSGTFTMTLIQSDACNLDGRGAYVAVEHPGGTASMGNCSSGNMTLTMRYNQGVYDPVKDVTYYRVHVQLHLPDDYDGTSFKGYRFQVSSSQPALAFGNWGNLPFVLIPDGNQGAFTTLNITQQPPCVGGPFFQSIISRDYDNFGSYWSGRSSRAQEDSGGNFSPLQVSVNPWGAGNMNSSGSTTQSGLGWINIGGYRYEPHDTGSKQYDTIEYMWQPRTTYTYTIHNLGQNNFIRLDLPFDGNPWACPSATVVPRNDGPTTVNVGESVNLRAWLEGAGISGSPGSMGWRIEQNVNGGAYGPYSAANTSGTTPVANGQFVNWTESRSFSSSGVYCFRIARVGSPPSGVSMPVDASPGQCITVRSPAGFTVSTTADNSGQYEKGSSSYGFQHNIIISSVPCDPASAVGTPSSYDWTASPGVPGIGTPVTGTVQFFNCQNRITISGGTHPRTESFTISGGSTVTLLITNYDTTPADRATLDGLNPGDARRRFTTVGSVTDNPGVAVTVYEAPFVRFFGQDVSICGTGDDNRFTFDNTTGDQWKGSFAEYASIYLSGNQAPNADFSGLNSAVYNNFPGALDTNFSGNQPAGACRGGVEPSTDFVGATIVDLSDGSTLSSFPAGKVTYRVNGSVTLTGASMGTTGTKSPFSPSVYPVVLIYATGDINIASNVTFIEAVLVAGGSINTCTTSAGGTIPKVNLEQSPPSGCRNPLKIYGAVSASTINYQRAIGTRFLADATTTTTVHNGNETASEIVDYPWYLNFVQFNLADTSQSRFDAYYALPPRL